MPTITRNSGLKVTVSETYKVTAEAAAPGTPSRASTRGPGERRFGPIPIPTEAGPSDESAAIVEALDKQEMQLVDTIELKPELEPTTPTGVRRRGAASVPATQTASLEIDVQPGEDAVVLVEQDGLYSWVFPAERTEVQGPDVQRGMRATPKATRVTFHIDVHATSTPERRRDRRGFFTDLIYSKVKAMVLKFAARIVVGQAMKFLERKVERGIVVIDSENSEQWRRVENMSSVRLPQDRAARVLLLVHGTFSSTAGSFGALSGTPWGRAFLAGTLANYDVVIGFDHRTLCEDPLTNAVDLLERLQGGKWTHAPQVDAIAFSRGALVLRSLVEHLLPASNWAARFDRAVFVGCTNGGTTLAEPENWHALVDLYTNLATGAARLLGMMPQATAPMKILSEAIQGLGALVKFMATEVVTTNGVPGLAAMEPDGEFITKINKTQPGQQTPDRTWYYAITSEFEARVLGNDHEPKELPHRLVLALADGFVDQLMKDAPNDLVVDTASMTKIDPQAGQFVRDTFDFGATPQVYHLNYFTRPEVTNALTRWLTLAAPTADAIRRRSGVTVKPLSQRRAPVGIAPSEAPAIVDTDILVTDVMTSVREAIAVIKAKAPSSVVLRRSYQGKVLNYAMSTENLLERISTQAPKKSLFNALDLHEYQHAKTRSMSSVLRGVLAGRGPADLEVVMAGNDPVGVLVGKIDLPDATKLVQIAKRTLKPQVPGDYIAARRAMPTFTESEALASRGKRGLEGRTRGAADAGRASIPEPTTVKCHFRVEMEEEVLLKRATTIEVNVSREVIGDILHAAAAEATGDVDPTRKLLIQIIPKRNFEMVNEEEDRVEIDPPEPDKPKTFYFDVRATHNDGGEGELWVVARQGQVPLARLILRPRIVKKHSASVLRTGTSITTPEARPLLEPLTQLTITEQLNGSELRYLFQLQSPKLGILASGKSEPIRGSREQYVSKLYSEIENRWISSAGDVDNFYEELRAYGAELFDELVPANIQQALWQHRDMIDSIMVIAEEPFIPWEVMHLVEPGKTLTTDSHFFGEMGLVRWLYEAGWPSETIPHGANRARFVIPDYPHRDYKLPEALKEAKFLKAEFKATEVQPTSEAVRKLLSTPGAFDLLHFACHGSAEQEDKANAALLLKGRIEGDKYIPDYFNATTAEYHSHFRRDGQPGPMIVLNACQVGRASYKLTGTGGFARAFLRNGASVFVGALWSVGDSPARTFTEEFYTQLKDHNARIADATKAARSKAKQAGDATWLAYVVYGHPHGKFT